MTSAWDSSHAPAVPWRSGPWSLELRDDELADVRFDGRRVLRSIRAVVRDRDWNTAAFQVESVRADEVGLEVVVATTAFGADVRATVRAAATDSLLRVSFDAVSASEFLTNRTGLVVLHPAHVAGAELTVTHSNGAVEQTAFPRAISPHQPVFDIAGLAWADDGIDVAVTFEGDIFEMEDQRNWTDASFKTYSRPLALPFPYRLDAGAHVRQALTIGARPAGPVADAGVPICGDAPRHAVRGGPDPASREARPQLGAEAASTASRIELRADGAFPQIVLGASSAPDPEPPGIPAIGSALLVELDLGTPNWVAALARAARRGLPLDVRIVPAADALSSFDALAIRLIGLSVARVAAFSPDLHISDAATLAALRASLSAAGVDAPVVGGSRAHFTELNRERHRIPDDLDGIAVTVTSLFHAVGTEQLVESIAMQRLVARQTVGLAAGRPVHVGPIALRPRFNNVATGPQPAPTRADLSEGYGAEFTGGVDARQTSPELAAWVIASAAALAVPGVASIAYFEEWGARGIRSTTGEPFPVAEAIALLAELSASGGRLLWGESADGLLWAIGASDAAGSTVLVANLDARPRQIAVTVARAVEPDTPSPATGSMNPTKTIHVEPHGFQRIAI